MNGVTPESIRATLCITFAGRSGSFLLSNLLDDHPEVLAIPPHAGAGILNGLLEALGAPEARSSVEKLVDAIAERNAYLFSSTDHSPLMGDAAKLMKLGVDKAAFKRHLWVQITRLTQRQAVSFENIFNAVHIAYAQARGRVLTTDKPVIALQQHFCWPEQKDFFAKNFRNMHFVVCIRRPEISVSAHFQTHLVEFPQPPIWSLASRITHQFVIGATVLPGDSRTIAVRFEDLHTRTEQVMRAVAKHFSLAWDPILLRTTIDGETAYFPKTKGGKPITGTNPAAARVTATANFSWFDRWRLRYAWAADYAAWGYDVRPRPILNLLFGCPWLRERLFAIPTKMQMRAYASELRELLGRFRAERAAIKAELLARRNLVPGSRVPVSLLPLESDAVASAEPSAAPDSRKAAVL